MLVHIAKQSLAMKEIFCLFSAAFAVSSSVWRTDQSKHITARMHQVRTWLVAVPNVALWLVEFRVKT